MTVVVLNGTSSAGKTTIARAVQDASPTPVLRMGIDDLFAMCPEEWAGGKPGRFAEAGFSYLELPDGRSRIAVGPEGRRILTAFHRAVAAAGSGLDVVMDYLSLEAWAAADLETALTDIDHVWVRVSADPEVLVSRERTRGQHPGLALGFVDVVHEGIHYDLEVDTSTGATERSVGEILTVLGGGRSQMAPAR